MSSNIYYDWTRKRYRLRLQKEKRIIHCSYHKTLEEAENKRIEVMRQQNTDLTDVLRKLL